MSGASAWRGAALAISLLLLIAGCAPQGGGAGSSGNPLAEAQEAPAYAPTRYYPPPGPPDDPWGPYIAEAAARFQIPQQWIRAVMQQESGGEEQAVSPVGAMGLMQLMPETYQELQTSYGLGDDPFDPENNILAGAAYIREMDQRYGAPGFLAAYNAGPEDVDAYLAGTSSLPDETVNYLAAVTPNLGNAVAFSGPFADYAGGGSAAPAGPTLADFASGCDVNAAYDPDHPCGASSQNGVIAGQPVILAAASAGTCDSDNAYDPGDPCSPAAGGGASAGTCDLDAAYDPDSPCTPAPAPTAAVETAQADMAQAAQSAAPPECGPDAAFNPACPATVLARVDAGAPPEQTSLPAPASPARAMPQATPQAGRWGIQVGAFANAGLARSMAQNARDEVSGVLGNADISLAATTPFGGNILYQARLIHLSAAAAVQACSALNQRQLPCVVVRPFNA